MAEEKDVASKPSCIEVVGRFPAPCAACVKSCTVRTMALPHDVILRLDHPKALDFWLEIALPVSVLYDLIHEAKQQAK